jgi:hypothetical protein
MLVVVKYWCNILDHNICLQNKKENLLLIRKTPNWNCCWRLRNCFTQFCFTSNELAWGVIRKVFRWKISHLVASLLTNRQQVVFALLAPSCPQVWNNLSTACWYYQTCSKVVPTSPIQSWCNNIVTTLWRQPCNILVISRLYQTC